MLDATTKRRIDTARDILVGKVPDPKSQVEQITIALIYKFMDDMDAEAEEFGGERKFFAGDFARYGWAKLMHSGLGGHETLNLYAEAITKMPENPGIPPLFRDIFKNAYLPYRDPETLRSFLKIIDEFTYDHSERLGDAFEYLLSVLGSQGDAGQFRTPRHIIDFIVSVVDPKKDETVLDPACGTAGFLISSYKHILKNNTSPKEINGNGGINGTEDALHISKIPRAKGDLLTPGDKGLLARNFKGYDISPDMVRLSLVNMYLHGFVDPHIYEYDTLTSQDRWNEHADVILANPPFMSPKGGIKPHNRFSVQSKRSEVLFVDYIAEHLTPTGRAGIIVPEGIIFQSQNAYKQLRKMLVEEYLVAVVSMPAGVFNPYSGVKTSILFLDRTLAKRSSAIAFFKVENDGFNLGAQRRPIDNNDLPQVQAELGDYLHRLHAGEPIGEFKPAFGIIVDKKKISENDDYNLNGERYRQVLTRSTDFPLVFLGDNSLFKVESGGTPKSDIEEYWNGGIPWVTLVDLPANNFITQLNRTQRTISELGLRNSSAKMIPANSVIVSTRATIGRIAINRIPITTNQGFKSIVIINSNKIIPEYVALSITKLIPIMDKWATGGTFKEISKERFCMLQIPLPPMEIQKEIVAEVEGYQKVIDGARAVVDNYRPHIQIDPDWPMVELGKVCEVVSGQSPESRFYNEECKGTPFYQGKTEFTDKFLGNPVKWTTQVTKLALEDDILISVRAPVGPVNITKQQVCIGRGLAAIRSSNKILMLFLFAFLRSKQDSIKGGGGTVFDSISRKEIESIKIPLPPLGTQETVISEIETEQEMIETNKKLIKRFEGKINAALTRIWGD